MTHPQQSKSIVEGPVFTGRLPANAVPESTYRLPASDHDLPDPVRDLLRVHPIAYGIGREWFARCPTCEQWTRDGGCDVRKLAPDDIEAARKLHDEREWPASTGKATTTFRGMKPDYSRVTFEYADTR